MPANHSLPTFSWPQRAASLSSALKVCGESPADLRSKSWFRGHVGRALESETTHFWNQPHSKSSSQKTIHQKLQALEPQIYAKRTPFWQHILPYLQISCLPEPVTQSLAFDPPFTTPDQNPRPFPDLPHHGPTFCLTIAQRFGPTYLHLRAQPLRKPPLWDYDDTIISNCCFETKSKGCTAVAASQSRPN